MGAGKLPEDIEKQAEDRRRQLEPMSRDLAALMAAEQSPRSFTKSAKLRKTRSSIAAVLRRRISRQFSFKGLKRELKTAVKFVEQLETELVKQRKTEKKLRQQIQKLESSLRQAQGRTVLSAKDSGGDRESHARTPKAEDDRS